MRLDILSTLAEVHTYRQQRQNQYERREENMLSVHWCRRGEPQRLWNVKWFWQRTLVYASREVSDRD